MTFPNLGTQINHRLVYCVANAHSNGFDCCANDCGGCVSMAWVHWHRAFLHNLLLHQVFAGPFLLNICLFGFRALSKLVSNSVIIIMKTHVINISKNMRRTHARNNSTLSHHTFEGTPKNCHCVCRLKKNTRAIVVEIF